MNEQTPTSTDDGGTTMPWGFTTLGCVDFGLEEAAALARRFGIHHLEIRGLGEEMHGPTYFNDVLGGADEGRRILHRFGQRITSLDTSFKLAANGADDRRELVEYATLAEALDVPYLRVFGGGSMAEPLTEDLLERAAEHLAWWSGMKAEKGWRTELLLETHDGFCSSERVLTLQERAGGDLGIIWDTHHTWKLGGEDVEETWSRIGHLVRHLHIKDSVSKPSARHPYTYVLPGTGEFPAQATLDILDRGDFNGVVCLEWERKWHPYLPPLEEALQACETAGWRRRS
jgi:sugar phosphate isomerase/epimerase